MKGFSWTETWIDHMQDRGCTLLLHRVNYTVPHRADPVIRWLTILALVLYILRISIRCCQPVIIYTGRNATRQQCTVYIDFHTIAV